MAELVKDRLAVFGLVDVARTEQHRPRPRAVPRAVLRRTVRVRSKRLVEDPALAAIAEPLEVMNRAVNMEIDHRLVESALVAVKLPAEIRLTLDARFRKVGRDTDTVEEAAAVETSQSNVLVRLFGGSRG